MHLAHLSQLFWQGCSLSSVTGRHKDFGSLIGHDFRESPHLHKPMLSTARWLVMPFSMFSLVHAPSEGGPRLVRSFPTDYEV